MSPGSRMLLQTHVLTEVGALERLPCFWGKLCVQACGVGAGAAGLCPHSLTAAMCA